MSDDRVEVPGSSPVTPTSGPSVPDGPATGSVTPMDVKERRSTEKTRAPSSDAPPPWRTEGVPSAPKKRSYRPTAKFWWILIGLLAVNWFIGAWVTSTSLPAAIPYTEFRQQLEAGNVAEVRSRGDTIEGKFKQPTAPSDSSKKIDDFRTERPTYAQDDLLRDLDANGVVVRAESLTQRAPLWQQLLVGFAPTLLFVGLFVFIMRRAGGALGGLASIGRSKARRVDGETGPRATFEDVAGIEEVKGELSEIV
ncbi:MAG: cell division protease FtsH, partial [Acidimicrobiaceae bacterium]|nr:cell division protease FtsH [Acidimicrobiaceae bacterium]